MTRRKTVRRSKRTRPSGPRRRRPTRQEAPLAEERGNVGGPDAREPDVAIVAVGASAGGLEAFSQLLGALPSDPGFGMVLVQHLAPQHESSLATLLSASTAMPVVQATEGMCVETNHVYVIPPNVQMGLRDGHLHLVPRPTDRSQYTPIDFFLRSVADALQDRAIGVILSGTASDGTGGIREVKAVGGITIAQSPETAKYDGMPRSAIATGLVDLVLPPEQIAHELIRISRHPLRPVRRAVPMRPGDDVAVPGEEQLERVFALLRSATGVDFRRYKRPTIHRRLQRRMVLHKLTRIEPYLKLLHENPAEIQLLYQDLLIHVTRFFREPESFAAISAVLPQIVETQREDQPIRIWVPGCSTGEEAYSIAIVVLEFFAEHNISAPIQVFATDVSESAIEHARTGTYAEGITADVSSERLRRFFTRVDGHYRVTKAVRDVCIFARQDLTRDPPFSKLDVILCRNVLIYMGAELQKRLMNVFHYALKPTGFLVLGAAETIGVHSDLFAIVDKKFRIYQKKLAGPTDGHLPFEYTSPVQAHPGRDGVVAVARDDIKSVQGEANRLIQDRYAPPGVIVDQNLQIVQFRGQTGPYLEPAPGDPSMHVFKMVRDGMLHALRSAVQEARRTHGAARRRGLRVRSNGGWRETTIEVVPLSAGDRPHLLILFEDTFAASKRGARAARTPIVRVPSTRAAQQVAALQQELASSREYLQSIIQELEAANEELQSANEEVLSANEELQSTNEELDTAKEELQSTNEELNTVNDELHGRNDELGRLNSDLMNLLASVNIAIVIVSNDLRIRRFTPIAEQALNLLPGDVGRPIGHIKPNIDCPELEELTMKVIDSVTPTEREVRDRQGRRYSLRIRPYKDVENRIEGAVLTLFELQRRSDENEVVRRVRDAVAATLELVEQPVAVLDQALRVHGATAAFRGMLGLSDDGVDGRVLDELTSGRWDARVLRDHLERLVRDEDRFDGLELAADVPERGSRTLVLRGRRLAAADDGTAVIVLAVGDAHESPSGGKGGR